MLYYTILYYIILYTIILYYIILYYIIFYRHTHRHINIETHTHTFNVTKGKAHLAPARPFATAPSWAPGRSLQAPAPGVIRAMEVGCWDGRGGENSPFLPFKPPSKYIELA